MFAVLFPSAASSIPGKTERRLIVIGFMGGRIKGDNFLHTEARLAKDLRQSYPLAVDSAVFANHVLMGLRSIASGIEWGAG
jgi:putative cell wall-binding protein